MYAFIQLLGPLFWIMLAFTLLGVAVVGERLFYFHRVNLNSGEFLRGLSALLRSGHYSEALHEARQLPGPMARVVEAVLVRPKLTRSEMRDIAMEAAGLEVYGIEKHIRILACAATVLPLLGLLGTLLALIGFYEQPGVTRGAAVTPEIAATVIQALTGAALGIAVAIPLYLFYMYLAGRAREVINKVERVGLESVHLICDVRMKKPAALSVEAEATDSEQDK